MSYFRRPVLITWSHGHFGVHLNVACYAEFMHAVCIHIRTYLAGLFNIASAAHHILSMKIELTGSVDQ